MKTDLFQTCDHCGIGPTSFTWAIPLIIPCTTNRSFWALAPWPNWVTALTLWLQMPPRLGQVLPGSTMLTYIDTPPDQPIPGTAPPWPKELPCQGIGCRYRWRHPPVDPKSPFPALLPRLLYAWSSPALPGQEDLILSKTWVKPSLTPPVLASLTHWPSPGVHQTPGKGTAQHVDTRTRKKQKEKLAFGKLSKDIHFLNKNDVQTHKSW